MQKSALIIIDVQNDYFPTGAFPLADTDDTLAAIELARKKAWHEANKEQQKKYREENRDRLLAVQRNSYEANKEKHLAKSKAYHEANKEQRNAKRKEKSLLATDSYLRSLSKAPLPPELIEAVRLKLFIKRKVLELKNETHQ
jgi:nicotinamidase-related amidase